MRGCAVVLAFCACLVPSVPLYAADGDLDPSFGATGIVTTPFVDPSSGNGRAGLALLPGGKILVAAIDSSGLQFARYDSTGMLDASFGTGGVKTVMPPGGHLNEIAVTSAGKILVLASTVVAQYDADGNPDTGFGTGGVATLPSCGDPVFYFEDLLVQADGRIVVNIADNVSGDSCIFRYTAAGAPDATFGVNGAATVAAMQVFAVGEQGTRLIVAGFGADASVLRRLLSNGDPDGGFATAPLSPPSSVLGLHVAGDGTILVVDDELQVRRFLPNGKVDETFGTNGLAPAAFDPYGADGLVQHIAVQRDGRIVIAVSTTIVSPPFAVYSFVDLVRYDVDGTLDGSFGGDGAQSSTGGVAGGMTLQPDGKIVVSSIENGNPVFMTTGKCRVARHFGSTPACPATAATGCHGATVPLAGTLRTDTSAGNPKAKYQWKWKKGAETMVTDFGDPVGGDDYTLCVYDESSGSTLATGATIPGGGTCRGKPCWKPLGTTGFAYKDSKRFRYGIASIKLKAGPAGKAQVMINGQGTNIPVTALPAPLPLRVQLLAENGQCWESVFSTTGATRNDAERYQGKSD